MFVFIVPMMPVRLRNSLREALFEMTLQSLKAQKSKNWKALILGEDGEEKNDTHFIYLKADDFPKVEKLKIGLQYLAAHPELNAQYVIRLDADDIISPDFISNIEKLPKKFDLYYDAFHVCVDPIYMKVSYRQNDWVPNTAVHKYEHAITPFGPEKEMLFLLDHDLYWHKFYKDKDVFKAKRSHPVYYRVLTPFSITSTTDLRDTKVDWHKHMFYLNSYGPWLTLSSTLPFFSGMRKISAVFEKEKPHRPYSYWLFNWLKHVKNIAFDISNSSETSPLQQMEYESTVRRQKQTCTRCILSTDDTPNIQFDRNGVCTYCNYYDYAMAELGSEDQKKTYLENKIREIKEAGKSKDYDCILGVSGGVDSSYLAYWAKENSLRPLVVHFDNGWNSELAVQNIHSICSHLGFSLQTYVIDWEEFRQLQLAYLRAGVIDIEVLTDHAIISTIYKLARKYNLRYTINGFNYATEAIMPKGWVFDKTDFRNIKDINDKFGKGRIRTYPHLTFFWRFWYSMFLKIESVRVLNYIPYNKDEAKKLLIEKLGWRDYGGKHYESVFTKFYQAYILPKKFGVDKRKAHLANLICSGQITKEQAYDELKKPLYTEEELRQEKNYVLKKFGIGETEFDQIMKEPPHKHTDFKTQEKLWKSYFKLIRVLRPWKK